MSAAPTRARDPLLAKIHIAKKQLGLEDDDYRAVLARVSGGKRSAKELTPRERAAAIAAFEQLGFRASVSPGARSRDANPARAGRATDSQARPLHAKARALWHSLYWLGEIDNRDERALDAFAKRTAGVDALRWADPSQAVKIIEGLKDWCARSGFTPPDLERARELDRCRRRARCRPGGVALAARAVLIEALWTKLIAAGALEAGAHASLETWLRNHYAVAAPWFLTENHSWEAVQRLGRWYRRTIGKEVDPL